jgi:hypothetical protein
MDSYTIPRKSNWWQDKIAWLKSFNKPPVVKFEADYVLTKGEGYFLQTDGRVDVKVTLNVLEYPEKE